jgi:hypothetical protein
VVESPRSQELPRFGELDSGPRPVARAGSLSFPEVSPPLVSILQLSTFACKRVAGIRGVRKHYRVASRYPQGCSTEFLGEMRQAALSGAPDSARSANVRPSPQPLWRSFKLERRIRR